MGGVVICGTQWGDEGKGMAVDLLAEGADLIVRYQGGNNAGHTVIVDGEQQHPVASSLKGRASFSHSMVSTEYWAGVRSAPLMSCR